MSDEKRPTRLLPFRLRRAAHARTADYACEARELSADAVEFSEDAELSTLLRAWDAPEPSARSRERLLKEFRAGGVRTPFWRRALSAELRVPLPVAACAALALLASLFTFVARTQVPAHSAAAMSTKSTDAYVRTTDAPAVKIVELPVEHERVVTRIVYVERNAPRAEAQRLAMTQQTGMTQQSASTRRGAAERGVAQSASNSEAARGARTAVEPGAQSTGEPTSYFTRVDMADFQPADEMKIRIVKRGKTDEK
ncbi:MAG: hypothetical protein ACJ74Q_16325 [Pyrinomonadaceae bacterium]